MPDFSASFNAFFKTDDVRNAPQGTLGPFTILSVEEREVGQEKDIKVCMTIKEDKRAIVLNKTNYESLSEAFKASDTDKWLGKKVTLRFNPDVKYAGKKVGGITIVTA